MRNKSRTDPATARAMALYPDLASADLLEQEKKTLANWAKAKVGPTPLAPGLTSDAERGAVSPLGGKAR